MLRTSRVVAIVVSFCFCLVFLFVPETFWDRTPHAHTHQKKHFDPRHIFHHDDRNKQLHNDLNDPPGKSLTIIDNTATEGDTEQPAAAQRQLASKKPHVAFESGLTTPNDSFDVSCKIELPSGAMPTRSNDPTETLNDQRPLSDKGSQTHTLNSPSHSASDGGCDDLVEHWRGRAARDSAIAGHINSDVDSRIENEKAPIGSQKYTAILRSKPQKSYVQTLKPWSGRLNHDKWLRVAIRPLILCAYPAILWSSLVYALSIGWLIVLSESITTIFENRATYNFTALQAGLVYISPFVGGILGTAVAGKFSDFVVRRMSQRNDGIYEPEFRLVMAIPILLSTGIGLMGYGWSVEERDNYIVPTVFFGIISFGCSLGSTTSITFAVDSYRQYAGEALVTLNFCKSKLIYLLPPIAAV